MRELARTLDRAPTTTSQVLAPFRLEGHIDETNRHLEHLRGSALGFRNLTSYIARSLLETGGFRPRVHPRW